MTAYSASLAAHGPSDPFWQLRTCFEPPPDAVWEAAGSLSQAADAALAGDHRTAIEAIRAAERAELLVWGVPVMSVVNPEIIRWRPIDEATLPPNCRVDGRGFGPSLLDAMYRRDGWRCRFCGCPVVHPAARTRLAQLLPGAFRWTACYGDHAGFFVLSGVADHVQPHSWSGPTSLDNLVTCCQPCNYGRGPAFVAEMGLIDPRSRDPYPADGWDGLERMLGIPQPALKTGSMPTAEVNMTAWKPFAHLVRVQAAA